MKTYAVHFRNQSTENYEAHGFTQKDGKYYFHKQSDLKDFESFAEESEVVGIDCLGDSSNLDLLQGGGSY